MLVLAESTITEQSWVPLGGVCAVGVVLIGVIIKLTVEMVKFRVQVDRLVEEQWTVKDQKIFELELRLRNKEKGIDIPDSYAISRSDKPA
jgi:hypothetical protein